MAATYVGDGFESTRRPVVDRTPWRRASADARIRASRRKQPLAGEMMDPAEVAHAAVYFLSDESRVVTGSCSRSMAAGPWFRVARIRAMTERRPCWSSPGGRPWVGRIAGPPRRSRPPGAVPASCRSTVSVPKGRARPLDVLRSTPRPAQGRRRIPDDAANARLRAWSSDPATLRPTRTIPAEIEVLGRTRHRAVVRVLLHVLFRTSPSRRPFRLVVATRAGLARSGSVSSTRAATPTCARRRLRLRNGRRAGGSETTLPHGQRGSRPAAHDPQGGLPR